jgi:phosphotransacetylase
MAAGWCPMSFMEQAYEKVKGRDVKVVYPEGLEERALRAAAWLRDRDLVAPVLVGKEADVRDRASSLPVSLEGIEIRDAGTDPRRADLENEYLELRRHKGMTPEKARDRVSLPHYFGALLVRAGEAAGMVSGLNSETKPFLPAFEVIKMQEGFARASSVFVMAWPERVVFYADCSMKSRPTRRRSPRSAGRPRRARARSATSRAWRSCRSRRGTARRTPRSTG